MAIAPLVVTAPGLVLLVGAAGAGKTTLAARLFDAADIVSSDELRGAIRGDPADQTTTRTAFSILHREVAKRLFAGRLVVVDATNLTVAARAALLRRASAVRAPAAAIVLVPPADVVHARNARRGGRVVPADVVDRQLAAAAALGTDPQAIAARLRAEGVAEVAVATTAAEIDAIAVITTTRSTRPR